MKLSPHETGEDSQLLKSDSELRASRHASLKLQRIMGHGAVGEGFGQLGYRKARQL